MNRKRNHKHDRILLKKLAEAIGTSEQSLLKTVIKLERDLGIEK